VTARATTTSQDLVPKGLPQGSRQQIVQQMQEANVPLSSEGGGVGPTPSTAAVSPAAAGSAAPVSRQGLSNFDVFQNREPTPDFQGNPNLDPVALFQARLAESPNTALRYYFGRFQDFLE
jgi:hypothetical protein